MQDTAQHQGDKMTAGSNWRLFGGDRRLRARSGGPCPTGGIEYHTKNGSAMLTAMQPDTKTAARHRIHHGRFDIIPQSLGYPPESGEQSSDADSPWSGQLQADIWLRRLNPGITSLVTAICTAYHQGFRNDTTLSLVSSV